jgi:hypothetical protein
MKNDEKYTISIPQNIKFLIKMIGYFMNCTKAVKLIFNYKKHKTFSKRKEYINTKRIYRNNQQLKYGYCT